MKTITITSPRLERREARKQRAKRVVKIATGTLRAFIHATIIVFAVLGGWMMFFGG